MNVLSMKVLSLFLYLVLSVVAAVDVLLVSTWVIQLLHPLKILVCDPGDCGHCMTAPCSLLTFSIISMLQL